MSTLGLETFPGRCPAGFDSATQHPDLCQCEAGTVDEWRIFVAAIKRAARPDGTVHQGDVRPLIQRIPHKHRGQLYRRARDLRLIVDTGDMEKSSDAAGRNTDKFSRIYKLGKAA